MSSVNVNVGFSNERNSSRVLKPPGGGHTDIFNVDHKESSTVHKETVIKEKVGEAEITQQKSAAVNTVCGGTAEPQKRDRVPPGGFSSGLW